MFLHCILEAKIGQTTVGYWRLSVHPGALASITCKKFVVFHQKGMLLHTNFNIWQKLTSKTNKPTNVHKSITHARKFYHTSSSHSKDTNIKFTFKKHNSNSHQCNTQFHNQGSKGKPYTSFYFLVSLIGDFELVRITYKELSLAFNLKFPMSRV
jgi:hypothetical protein